MKNEDKNLEDADIILNLDEIEISNIDSSSSSSCGGRAYFNINCQTKHGYCEDPDFTGKIKILEAKKGKEKGVYLLKVNFERYDDD
ncbi:MAG: hypothetical protein U9R34_01865 [Nanoarchaeota archaeon]|nr:hypothetical protein [Nanoarchaeota archaeon]